MWKGSIYLLILVLLVSGLLVPHVFASDSCTAPTGYFCFPTTNGFTLATYGTTVGWSQTIDTLSYTLFGDHLNLTSATLGSSGVASTFGFGGEYTNETWSVQTANSLNFSVTAPASGQSWAYEWFYYLTVPDSVTLGTTTFGPEQYNTSLTNFNSSPSNAVYWNSASNYLETKTSTTLTISYSDPQVTLTNSYPSGTCSGGDWEYYSGGAVQKVQSSALGVTVSADPNSYTFPIVGSGSSTNQCSASPLTQGLVGYWPLSEQTSGTCTGSVYDLSGNNNTGTCVNSPTYVSGPFAGSGALNFSSASSQHVKIPNSASLDGAGAFSFITWAKFAHPADTGTAADVLWENYQLSPSTNGWNIRQDNNRLLSDFYSSGTHYSGPSYSFAFSTSTFYFIVITYDGSSVSKLYFNSVLESTVTGVSLGASNQASGIGGNWIQNQQYMNGVQAFTGFYSYALTPSEISELYHTTMPNLEHQVTTSGQTFTTNWYNQYLTNATYSVLGSGSPSAPAFTYYNLGQQINLTLSTSAQSIWVDSATTYVFQNPISDGTKNYYIVGAATGTIVGSNTYTGVYEVTSPTLVNVTLTLTIANSGQVLSGTNSMTVHFYRSGSPSTFAATDGINSFQADANSSISITSVSAQSNSSVRWCVLNCQNSANVGSASTFATTWDYWYQVNPTVQYSAAGTVGGALAANPIYSSYQTGNLIKGQALSVTATHFWVDNNSVVTPQPTWFDNGHVYSVSPTSITIVNQSEALLFAYSATNQTQVCQNAGTNTTSLFNNQCYTGGVVNSYANIVTLPIFYSFGLAICVLPIYKKGNILMTLTVTMILAGALVSALGVLSIQIELLLWFGLITTTAFVFVRLWKGRQSNT